jgi:hypothetical protein
MGSFKSLALAGVFAVAASATALAADMLPPPYNAGFGFKLKPLDAHEARIGVRYMID